MPFAVPVTFSGNTTLAAEDLRDNYQAVRTQYHNVPQDLLRDEPFVNTQHIQPPRVSPVEELVHGVSGLWGNHTPLAPWGNVSFASDAIGGFNHVSRTSFSFVPRFSCNLLLHWWAEVIAGPDASSGSTLTDRLLYCWVSPYRGSPNMTDMQQHAQECQNNWDGWSPSGAPGKGAEQPYEWAGASFMSGTFPIRNAPAGQELRVGLAAYANLGRAVILNYGVSVEAYYI